MSRYKFYNEIKIDNNKKVKGFMKSNFKELITFDDDEKYTIPLQYEFRPDLIADLFYEDPKLSYILIYANDINDSPEGFYKGRKIRVPRFERIINII